jgi:two-component system, cell cycle sensor histidine kinase and response regulator CckA
MGLFQRLGGLLFEGGDIEPEPAAQPLVRRTVLVIDDDPLFLEAICRVLQEAGFAVLKSSTGPKGLNMLRYGGSEIQLVLLDYHMPQLDGSATLQFARKLNPHVKVVGLTGVDTRLLPASYREGVAAVVRKPFQSSELIAALERVLTESVAGPAPAHAVAAAH